MLSLLGELLDCRALTPRMIPIVVMVTTAAHFVRLLV